jgi:hypothetical protein
MEQHHENPQSPLRAESLFANCAGTDAAPHTLDEAECSAIEFRPAATGPNAGIQLEQFDAAKRTVSAGGIYKVEALIRLALESKIEVCPVRAYRLIHGYWGQAISPRRTQKSQGQ